MYLRHYTRTITLSSIRPEDKLDLIKTIFNWAKNNGVRLREISGPTPLEGSQKKDKELKIKKKALAMRKLTPKEKKEALLRSHDFQLFREKEG